MELGPTTPLLAQGACTAVVREWGNSWVSRVAVSGPGRNNVRDITRDYNHRPVTTAFDGLRDAGRLELIQDGVLLTRIETLFLPTNAELVSQIEVWLDS